MANTENVNIVNEEVIDAAVKAAEAIPVKPNAKLGVIGAVVVVGGAIITGVAFGIRHIKNKKKAKEEQADPDVVDNIQVVKNDFEENDSTDK